MPLVDTFYPTNGPQTIEIGGSHFHEPPYATALQVAKNTRQAKAVFWRAPQPSRSAQSLPGAGKARWLQGRGGLSSYGGGDDAGQEGEEEFIEVCALWCCNATNSLVAHQSSACMLRVCENGTKRQSLCQWKALLYANSFGELWLYTRSRADDSGSCL